MRRTGLASGVDTDRPDYTIFSGDWAMGRIYENRGGPDSMRWFWSLHGVVGKPEGLRTGGNAPTLDEAKAQFETAWRRWLAWANLPEKPKRPGRTGIVLTTFDRSAQSADLAGVSAAKLDRKVPLVLQDQSDHPAPRATPARPRRSAPLPERTRLAARTTSFWCHWCVRLAPPKARSAPRPARQ